MKLGPVTELDKRNKTAPKKLMLTSCWKIVTLTLFALSKGTFLDKKR